VFPKIYSGPNSQFLWMGFIWNIVTDLLQLQGGHPGLGRVDPNPVAGGLVGRGKFGHRQRKEANAMTRERWRMETH
jgi:hypothetical protein